jgi:hypothetical protein
VVRTSLLLGLAACGLLSAACWGDGKTSAKPASKAQSLIAEAERQLAIAQTLDFQAPRRTTRFDARNKAAELYREACELRAGVSPCIWAVSLMVADWDVDAGSDQRVAAATDVLAARCLDKKDEAACRVFDAVEVKDDGANFSDPGALCTRGLADACNAALLPERACELGDPWGCARRAIKLDADDKKDESVVFRRKQHQVEDARCAARSFGVTCIAAASVDAQRPKTPETDAKWQRAQTIVAEGCKRGYLFECEQGDPETRSGLDLIARSCTLTGRQCDRLANARSDLKLGATAVRDALEHGCQFRVYDDCIELVKGYRSKQFAEPVPNRAAAITSYWCTEGSAGYSEAVCKQLRTP